jgi:hypothetical protein
MHKSRILLGAVLLLSLSAVPVWSAPPVEEDESPETFALKDTRGTMKAAKPAQRVPSQRLGLDITDAPAVRLEAVDVDELLREDQRRSRESMTKVLRYGVGRDLAVSVTDGHWYELEGGAKLWVGDVASADALGVRLRFSDLRLPEGSEVAVYGLEELDPRTRYLKGGRAADPVVEFLRPGSASNEFWTRTLLGDRVRIEYFVPADAVAAGLGEELPFAVGRLQHVYVDPVEKSASGFAKAAGPCHNDVSCFPQWADVARGVAGIGFIGDDAAICTGQLLNNKKNDLTPYFLTANHCQDTQIDAQFTEFFWFYQTATCGGPPPSIFNAERSLGATLLSTNPASDYTLLMVEGTLPAGVTWVGWNAKAIPNGLGVTAIHHPDGDYKRISFGTKGGVNTCGSFTFPESNHVRVNWTDAPTEPGSSGSGIFRGDNQQLFGQLHCGPSACGNETHDSYGSFALTYTRIKNFLTKGGSDDKSEQNDTCKKARTVKAGTQGSRIVKFNDADWYKITVPRGKTVTITANFSHGNGDIDLDAHASCAAGPIGTSQGTGNSESVSLTNVGRKNAFAYVRAYLVDDVRATYDLTVSIQ